LQVEARDEGGRRLIRMRGRWTVDDAATLAPLLQQAAQGAGGVLVFDASGIERMDLSGAWLLHAREGRLLQSGSRVEWHGGRPSLLGFIDRTLDGRRKTAPSAESPRGVQGVLHGIGLRTVRVQEGVLDFVGFLGAVTAGCGRLFGSLKRLRLPSVVRHVYETGLTAVPIVALIAFLISVIVAYIGAQQLRKFGGEIFVVDLVTVAVLRELGVLLTAIIVAGRSGSAFAAEIGAMKLNDEVDALRAIGMDPVEVLVLPRIIGLVIALPALTLLADAMGLAGGALLSWYWDLLSGGTFKGARPLEAEAKVASHRLVTTPTLPLDPGPDQKTRSERRSPRRGSANHAREPPAVWRRRPAPGANRAVRSACRRFCGPSRRADATRTSR
jgi:phospholipid/cholesterol/gamma-HCH transport system permease protein